MRDNVGVGSWKLLAFNSFNDPRGDLVALNGLQEIPFEIKRIYYMTGSEDFVRGLHAHKNLEQVLIAVSGSVTIKVTDGASIQEFQLKDRSVGLHIKDLVWREIYRFSPDCVLLAIASDVYRKSDYIHDYEEF